MIDRSKLKTQSMSIEARASLPLFFLFAFAGNVQDRQSPVCILIKLTVCHHRQLEEQEWKSDREKATEITYRNRFESRDQRRHDESGNNTLETRACLAWNMMREREDLRATCVTHVCPIYLPAHTDTYRILLRNYTGRFLFLCNAVSVFSSDRLKRGAPLSHRTGINPIDESHSRFV